MQRIVNQRNENKELSKKQLDTVKSALKSQGLMAILRGHYTQSLLDYRDHQVEDFDLEIKKQNYNTKQIKALEKNKRYFINGIAKDIKVFDKFIGDQLDKIEESSEMMEDVIDGLTDVFDKFFNKVFQFEGTKVNIINKTPHFFIDLKEYAESVDVPMATIKQSIKNKTLKTVIVDGETMVLI